MLFLSVPTNLYNSHVKRLFCTDAWQIQTSRQLNKITEKRPTDTHTTTRGYCSLPTDTLSFTAKFVIGRYSEMTSRPTLSNSETPLSAGGEVSPRPGGCSTLVLAKFKTQPLSFSLTQVDYVLLHNVYKQELGVASLWRLHPLVDDDTAATIIIKIWLITRLMEKLNRQMLIFWKKLFLEAGISRTPSSIHVWFPLGERENSMQTVINISHY